MTTDDMNKGLTAKILIGMGLGLVVGLFFDWMGAGNTDPQSTFAQVETFVVGGVLDVGGTLFISSLKMLVVPLVFVSLVCGVCSIGSGSRIGMISIKTLGFYMLTTALAISLALLISNVIDPGIGAVQAETAKEFNAKNSPGFAAVVKDLVPTNVIDAMAQGKMLQIIIFAILFGIALSKLGEEADLVRAFFVQMDKVVMFLVVFMMRFAPYGVFCLITITFAETGFDTIKQLILYFVNVLTVLFTHAFLSYGILLWFLTGLNPITFFKKMYKVWLFGFSTASSNATIPVTLDTVEKKMGVDNQVAAFTVPLGATINMDGTAIMQGVATVFIAQYFGVDLSFSDYLLVIATATLASVGTAGIPSVGLIMLALVLQQVNLPVEGIALIIGVDRILDMVRTAVNITGDSAASIIVAKSEKKFNREVFDAD